MILQILHVKSLSYHFTQDVPRGALHLEAQGLVIVYCSMPSTGCDFDCSIRQLLNTSKLLRHNIHFPLHDSSAHDMFTSDVYCGKNSFYVFITYLSKSKLYRFEFLLTADAGMYNFAG